MRKLWVFGDSFSTPFHLYKEYCDYKGYTPKTYYENVSEQFNLEIESHGFGGADNHTILDKVIDHIERIGPNDIVIIGWTDWFRTRVVNDNGEWECLNPGHINQPTINLTSYNINSIKSIILNRDHQKYIDEQNNIIKLVKFALKDNILIDWCWIDEYNVLDCEVKHIGRQKTILEETNKVIPDYHWCEEGHLNLSNKIIDHIHQKKSTDKVKVI
jgi:hypothetical protein